MPSLANLSIFGVFRVPFLYALTSPYPKSSVYIIIILGLPKYFFCSDLQLKKSEIKKTNKVCFINFKFMILIIK